MRGGAYTLNPKVLNPLEGAFGELGRSLNPKPQSHKVIRTLNPKLRLNGSARGNVSSECDL